MGALLAAAGALCAGVPDWLAGHGASPHVGFQAMFMLYALLGAGCAFCYRRLSVDAFDDAPAVRGPLRHSRRTVYTLAALFSLDAFAGGLIVQSMLALWLFQRFSLSPATAGLIFFWTGVLSSLSYLVAVKIAGRIGLVYTMVFTHVPSSMLLILVPFAPNLASCVALLLLRSALSQMDVPTRSAFVMSVVPRSERAAAASVTSVSRSIASSSSPLLAGYLLGASTFGWPLIAAGLLKIVYDLMLLAAARNMPSRGERRDDERRLIASVCGSRRLLLRNDPVEHAPRLDAACVDVELQQRALRMGEEVALLRLENVQVFAEDLSLPFADRCGQRLVSRIEIARHAPEVPHRRLGFRRQEVDDDARRLVLPIRVVAALACVRDTDFDHDVRGGLKRQICQRSHGTSSAS